MGVAGLLAAQSNALEHAVKKNLMFARYLGVRHVAGHGVFLFSENRQTALRGKLIEDLFPLLERGCTWPEILAKAEGRYSADMVRKSVGKLISAGILVSDTPVEDRRGAGYWEMAGLDADKTRERLRQYAISIAAVDGVDSAAIVRAAHEQGLRVDDDRPDLSIVLVDDFLHPRLREHNQRALQSDRPWIICRPLGQAVWLSPVFEPGRTACWECLAVRIEGHRMVDASVRRVLDEDRLVLTALADLPLTRDIAARLVLLEATKWLAGLRAGDDRLVELNTLSLETVRHTVTRRPQCPACGDPGMVARQAFKPPELIGSGQTQTTDGGYRAHGPEWLMREFGHLVSPITGIASTLTKLVTGTDLLHTYAAGHNFALRRPDVTASRIGLRHASAGKGRTDQQARASALGEAIERFSGAWQGDEARTSATYTSLGPDAAIDPSTLLLFSERQFARRENGKGQGHMHFVPRPFDPDETIDWSPVWSLTAGRHKHVPTSYLYYGHSEQLQWANSNGNAAGTTLEDAILQGFFELVERDSIALWWYNRVRRPAIDLDSFDDPYFTRWRQVYRDLGRETWVLDLTSDLDVPVAVAVSRESGGGAENILFGFGAHYDRRIAVSRALSEMNQFLPSLVRGGREGTDWHKVSDPEQLDWWQRATVGNQPYLCPLDGPPVTAGAPPADRDLLDAVLRAQRLIAAHGMELLVLDQTRPDVGLPVVKVMVPGLRHFWPRFAPGRLYDVPVRLGWLDRPTPEEELNPIAMFL
jgi:ribosomal protein S12 methylthiotransferase accessory factor